MGVPSEFEDWPRLRPLVIDALDQPPVNRMAFLNQACGNDEALRRRVEEFLRAYERGDDSLKPPSTVQDLDPLVGQRIGRYTVLRLIGCGGMGAVYQARQDQPSRIIALKLMRPGLATRSAQKRFEYESQLLARLHHPGIAQVYEAGTYDPQPTHPLGRIPYFAMEFVPHGVPITRFAQIKALDTRGKLELFALVCDAVHHGHQNGVIHRDLKPANILVGDDGQPKVIDFGVGRAIDADAETPGMTMATTAGQIIGTLQYLPPERLGQPIHTHGEHNANAKTDSPRDPHDTHPHDGVDIRSDIYALGVTLYELLAGRPPHALDGVALPDAMQIIRETRPAPLSGMHRTLRGDVDTIVRKAMEKDKERRYQSALEFASDIRRHLNHEPISAHPPSRTYQIRSFARRNKALVGGVAAAFVILLATVIIVSAALSHSVRMERQAIAQRDRARKLADFLKSTLVSANPTLSGDPASPFAPYFDPFADIFEGRMWIGSPGGSRNYTAAELMSQAARLLDVSFEDDPALRAEVADTLGVTLAAIGDDQALPLLRQAADIRRRVLGPDHIDTINSCLHLGSVLTGGGSAGEGEPYIRIAADALTRTLGPSDRKTLVALRMLAWNMSDRGLTEEATALARGNVQRAETAYGPNDPTTLAQVQLLASFSDPDQAAALAQRVADGLIAAFGADSIPAADAMATLGGTLRLRGEFEPAARTIAAALDVYRAHYGPDSPRLLDIERAMFEVLRRQGRFDEAADIVRSGLNRVRRAYSADHALILRMEDRLARALLEQGTHLAEAETLSLHASEGAVRLWGQSNVLSLLYVNTHAAALRRLGRVQEAEALVRPLVALQTDDEVLMPLETTLGACLIDEGRFDEAQRSLQSASRHAGQLFDRFEPRYVELLTTWVRLYETWGKPVEAEPYRAKLAATRGGA